MRYKFGKFVKSAYSDGNILNNKAINTEPLVALGYGKSIDENEPTNELAMRPDGLKVYQLLFIKEGFMQFKIDGKTIIYGPNTIGLYKPNQPQFYNCYGSDKCYRMHILFSGSDVEAYLKSYGIDNLTFSVPSETFNAFEDTINRMDYCRFNPHYPKICALLLEELFAHISYATEEKQVDNSSFDALHRFMIESCHKNYPIKVYADFLHFSEVYFVRFFKKAMGIPPHQYLLKIRFQKACQMLVSSNASIKEIAIKSGFVNPHYFSKSFNARFKMTPTEYRISSKSKKHLINNVLNEFTISDNLSDINIETTE